MTCFRVATGRDEGLHRRDHPSDHVVGVERQSGRVCCNTTRWDTTRWGWCRQSWSKANIEWSRRGPGCRSSRLGPSCFMRGQLPAWRDGLIADMQALPSKLRETLSSFRRPPKLGVGNDRGCGRGGQSSGADLRCVGCDGRACNERVQRQRAQRQREHPRVRFISLPCACKKMHATCDDKSVD